ncbi:hypothetical protein TNCV_2643471 [Trichonephila clavipes]|nr:hypothetical protein TNCV_2643471 [Trichonephila clavipes]
MRIKPQTLDHLEDNIRRVIADIRPQMLEKVIENWTSRLDYIRTSRGSPMREIIFKIISGKEIARRIAVKITPSCCLSEKWRIINLLDDIWMLLPEVESSGSWRKAAVGQHDFGDNFKLQEQLSGGSVVVVHEEPHPQMTGTLSYRPEETGGRQREKSLDTRHRRLDDRYRVLPWPEDCTVVVCLHDALYGVYL